MKNLILQFLALLIVTPLAAQILGGGQFFSTAVTFDANWTAGCPGSGTTFSNQAAFEPNTPMDPCGAPTPTNVSGTTGSDIWFHFYAPSTTAVIVVNPSASFDVGIQAFRGSSCGTLLEIGSVDANGNNATESLTLNGLSENVLYTFRIYGATNNSANRTGTYTLCGSTGLSGSPLPVEISAFTAAESEGKVVLRWIANSETDNAYFEIERGIDGIAFESIGKVTGKGTSTVATSYRFEDAAPLNATGYYRLKQVDNSGQASIKAYVEISVSIQSRTPLTVAPNPVAEQLSFRIGALNDAEARITIMDSQGRMVYSTNTQLLQGENAIPLNNLPTLPGGVYTLRCHSSTNSQTTKFIKLN